MNLLRKFCLICLILNLTFLLFADSYDDVDYEPLKKYDGDVPNDNKTCGVTWRTSWLSELTPSCWIVCKVRCIILHRTTQWRCKKSDNPMWENCHCCTD